MFTLLNRAFFITVLRSNGLAITLLTLMQKRINARGDMCSYFFLLTATLFTFHITKNRNI